MRFARDVGALLAVVLTAAPGSGWAQAPVPYEAGYSAERLRLGFSRQSLLDVEWGALREGLSWDVGVSLGYAHNPVVVSDPATGKRLGALIQSRLGSQLVAAIGYGPRFQLGLELPLVWVNAGQTDIPGATTTSLPSIAGAGVGDLRLAPKFGILRASEHVVDLAAQLNVTFPTSGGARFVGTTGTLLAPEVAVSKALGGVRLAGNLALSFRTSQPVVILSQRVDNALELRLGAAYRFNEVDPSKLPLELGGTLLTGFSLERPFARANQTPLELKAYGAFDVHPLVQVFAAFGVGVVRGFGVPDLRAVAGVRLSTPDGRVKAVTPPPDPGAADSDGDGLTDRADRCPKKREDLDGFEDDDGCPDPDNDDDGVLDADDRCPNGAGSADNDGCPERDTDNDGVADRVDRCPRELEDFDGWQDSDGCPDPDNDLDRVPDATDACPNTPGPLENRGCPAKDSDGDGVVDRLDMCASEVGSAANQGCKDRPLAVLDGNRIRLAEPVVFSDKRAVIDAKSIKVLERTAALINEHPELSVVRIDAHTDTSAGERDSLTLSQARADAVKDFLVRKGVQIKRLVAVGYGGSKPIADNGTKAGRAANQRVELFVTIAADGPKAPERRTK